MTVVKTLDQGPFFWHKYEKILYQLNNRGKPIYDLNRKPVLAHPGKDWYLPYEPIYILTNEVNVSAQIFALKDADPMTVDIINEDMYGEESSWLYCSIDKQLLSKLNI